MQTGVPCMIGCDGGSAYVFLFIHIMEYGLAVQKYINGQMQFHLIAHQIPYTWQIIHDSALWITSHAYKCT